mmetsp:Transcript_21790/g.73506  ORF Transcript_21790/g.73506 Transcript_21790/m.73506 type:complete len:200 (-) Transcript_21790:294-893(-)
MARACGRRLRARLSSRGPPALRAALPERAGRARQAGTHRRAGAARPSQGVEALQEFRARRHHQAGHLRRRGEARVQHRKLRRAGQADVQDGGRDRLPRPQLGSPRQRLPRADEEDGGGAVRTLPGDDAQDVHHQRPAHRARGVERDAATRDPRCGIALIKLRVPVVFRVALEQPPHSLHRWIRLPDSPMLIATPQPPGT